MLDSFPSLPHKEKKYKIVVPTSTLMNLVS